MQKDAHVEFFDVRCHAVAGTDGINRSAAGAQPATESSRCRRELGLTLTPCRGTATSQRMSDLPSAGGPSAPALSDSTSVTATDAANTSNLPVSTGGGEPNPTPSAPTGASTDADTPTPEPRRTAASLLMPSVLTLLSIGIVLWLIFAWSGYSSKYSQTTEGWKLNSTKMIEITVVAEDRVNLACASDVEIGGVHCGYRANQQPRGGEPASDSQVLQPFNTVANELFLGAGLWTSPSLPKQLPTSRFTVMCNCKVLGAAKSMSLRWAIKGSFDPLKSSVAVGALSDCVIPE